MILKVDRNVYIWPKSFEKIEKKLKPSHSILAIIYYFNKHHHPPEILTDSLKVIFDSFPSGLPLMRCHPLVAEFLASTAPSTLPVKNFTNALWHVLSTDVLASLPPLLHSQWYSWHRLPWSKLVFHFLSRPTGWPDTSCPLYIHIFQKCMLRISV